MNLKYQRKRKILQLFNEIASLKGEKPLGDEDAPFSSRKCDSSPLRSFSLLSTEQVVSLITAAPTKSCSLDPIPTRLLKQSLHILAPTITRNVNLSLSTSIFPSSMKHAIVTPVLKKPSLDRNTLGSYRPVSNLTFLSKLIERAVNCQLMNHLDDHDLLPDRQLLMGAGPLRFSFLTSALRLTRLTINCFLLVSLHAVVLSMARLHGSLRISHTARNLSVSALWSHHHHHSTTAFHRGQY